MIVLRHGAAPSSSSQSPTHGPLSPEERGAAGGQRLSQLGHRRFAPTVVTADVTVRRLVPRDVQAIGRRLVDREGGVAVGQAGRGLGALGPREGRGGGDAGSSPGLAAGRGVAARSHLQDLLDLGHQRRGVAGQGLGVHAHDVVGRHGGRPLLAVARRGLGHAGRLVRARDGLRALAAVAGRAVAVVVGGGGGGGGGGSGRGALLGEAVVFCARAARTVRLAAGRGPRGGGDAGGEGGAGREVGPQGGGGAGRGGGPVAPRALPRYPAARRPAHAAPDAAADVAVVVVAALAAGARRLAHRRPQLHLAVFLEQLLHLAEHLRVLRGRLDHLRVRRGQALVRGRQRGLDLLQGARQQVALADGERVGRHGPPGPRRQLLALGVVQRGVDPRLRPVEGLAVRGAAPLSSRGHRGGVAGLPDDAARLLLLVVVLARRDHSGPRGLAPRPLLAAVVEGGGLRQARAGPGDVGDVAILVRDTHAVAALAVPRHRQHLALRLVGVLTLQRPPLGVCGLMPLGGAAAAAASSASSTATTTTTTSSSTVPGVVDSVRQPAAVVQEVGDALGLPELSQVQRPAQGASPAVGELLLASQSASRRPGPRGGGPG